MSSTTELDDFLPPGGAQEPFIRMAESDHSLVEHHRPNKVAKHKSSAKRLLDTLFRALGLSVFLTQRNSTEEKKIAIYKSHQQALLRAAIHFIPITGCIVIIYLNITQHYIGASMKNISALQFAAKLHEMTMIASIGSMVLAYLRYELTLGGGLPFGATFASLLITQPSYLWSLEFWGSLLSTGFSWKKKAQFVSVIVIGIALAATVGPSSAIAMIPRIQYSPAGSTYVWFNGTYDEIYPIFFDALNISTDCSITSPTGGINKCPSSGWQGLLDNMPYLDVAFGGINIVTSDADYIAIGYNGEGSLPDSVGLWSAHSTRSLYTSESNGIGTTQPASMADALVLTGIAWVAEEGTRAFKWGSRLASRHTLDILQPFTTADCEADTPIVGRNDTRPVRFRSHISDWTEINSTTRTELWDTPGDVNKPRLVFIDLSGLQFPNVSIGVAVLGPYYALNNTVGLLSCLLKASWSDGQMTLSASNSDLRGSIVVQNTQFNDNPDDNLMKVSISSSFPLRHINVTKEWAQYINPAIQEDNTTVFGALASQINNTRGMEDSDIVELCQYLLIALFTNAVSNVALNFSIQGKIIQFITIEQPFFSSDVAPDHPAESADWLKLRVDSSAQGLAYGTEGLPIKIALTILICYCICAVLHIFYSALLGLSSSSWDSIAEMLALAINSRPTEVLENTCAGIKTIGVFKRPVRIVATAGVSEVKGFQNSEAEDELGHLELDFTAGNKMASGVDLVVNREYGTMEARCRDRSKG